MNVLPDHPLASAAFAWTESEQEIALPSDRYCETRDVLSTRIGRMTRERLHTGTPEDHAGLLDGILSEIGNNAFDHNIGSWPDLPGVFFAYDLSSARRICVIADRGVGIRRTISRIRPAIADDLSALKVAFLERISGRAPERRGNGLKFVRNALLSDGIDLLFQSGNAQYAVTEKKEDWSDASRPRRGCIAILTWSS